MLTFLFALFAIWTLFWFVMLMLDWGDRTPFTNSKVLCATCAAASGNAAKSNSGASTKSTSNKPNSADLAKASNSTAATAPDVKPAVTSGTEKAANPAAITGNKSTVTPLFKAPKEKDDLKIIKGIGLVMEKTLNDLGITTFAQLASFSQSDVDMVSERLSESNSGFGDRITRDDWVGQAKVFAKKAA